MYESCESRTASSCYVSSRPEVPEVASFRPHERSMWDRSSTAGVLNSRRRDKETSIAGVDLASGSVVVVEQRPWAFVKRCETPTSQATAGACSYLLLRDFFLSRFLPLSEGGPQGRGECSLPSGSGVRLARARAPIHLRADRLKWD